METEVKLKVMEAVQDDVNKGIVKIDSNFMKQIEVNPGDVVTIKGERETAAIVDRAYPGDIGLNIIRMDGNIRRNARTSIGEIVMINKAEVKSAKKISIAPAHKGVVVKASPHLFRHGLLGKALMKGDLVSIGRGSRRRTDLHGRDVDNIFSMMEDQFAGFGFGDLKFIVVDTNPKKEIVVVGPETEIEFNPHAVDIKEEEGISLGINYEDIGGLSEEIKKVREMVELPLKHPEVFEKLGIEAPKGVLLHGAPGTGKTLLAKAVASETNSHFILINGPEVISKFYGESLPYDEKVLVSENGLLNRVKIGDIVEKRKNVSIVCFDKENNVILRPVEGHIKHKRTSPLYKVITKSGKMIRVTADHSLFTLGAEGKIEEIKTSDLVPGKSFVVTPKKLPFPQKPLYTIDLLEWLEKKDYGLKIKNGHAYLQQALDVLGIKRCAEILNVRKKYVYDLYGKKVGIPVSNFLSLMKEAKVVFDKNQLQIGTKRSQFPLILNITPQLAEFFGFWLAEGSYNGEGSVRLHLHQDEIAYVSKLCMQLFGYCAVYHKKNSLGSDIFINSAALTKVMKSVLGFKPGSRNKEIPTIAYNFDRSCTAALLRGYFSGDGSVNRHGLAPQIEVSSASHDLIDGVAHLLLRFGITSKIYEKISENSKRLSFASYANLEKFKEIGFVCSDRNSVIFEYCNYQKFSRENFVPITGSIKELVNSNSAISAWKNSKTIGTTILQKHYPEIIFGDLNFDQVKEIVEEENQPEYVYDLSVPNCHNFVAGFGGIFAHNSEANLRKKFEEAEQNAPSIIFFDEIDAIATKREETRGDVEKRVVAQMLGLMDGLKSRGKVIVIAATNIPNQLDPALRRPGRFDREIEIGVPDKEGRLEILKIHTRHMPLAQDVKLEDVAKVTHGFVGADLNSLAKEAAMIVLRRILPELKVEGIEEGESIPKEILEKLMLHQKDFMESLKVVRPSAMREVLVETPDIGWKDVGGLAEVKEKLKEAVEWPLKQPGVFNRMGIRPPRGILLYGPPGTGKTMLAKAVAKESEANFILVNGPSLLSKWVGESEKAVREIFRKARQTAPTILFFDEIDALAPKRSSDGDSKVNERVVNQMLTEMDGLESLNDVVIIAATNRPDIVDPALLRQGRFDRVILAPVPKQEGRKKIFEIYLEKMPQSSDINLDALASCTEGYVGADIEGLCREAAMIALREDVNAKEVTMRHFKSALEVVKPSVDKEVEEAYENLETYFGSARAKEIKGEKVSYFG
jgi:SpoVK/Ycf46/Vps4 family AAA+-type ATPase/intein/homing endonuclease